MLQETVANRYAEALYSMTREKGEHRAQLKELAQVHDIFRAHPPLGRAIQSPTVPSAVKRNILHQLLEKRVSQRTLHFFYLLVDKNRELYIKAVVEAFNELIRRDEGVVKCRAEVAGAVDDAFKKSLMEQLTKITGSKIELEVVENPSLLGGAVLTIGDRLIDGSFSSQLTHMRQRFVQAATVV